MAVLPRSSPSTACILATALVLLAAPARAGSQGVGLPNPELPPDEDTVERFLMNSPGEAVPEMVCVDAGQIPCFDLRVRNLFNDPEVFSPDCPPGGSNQACRPEIIGGAALSATLDLHVTDAAAWDRTDVSATYPLGACTGRFDDLVLISGGTGTTDHKKLIDVGDTPYLDSGVLIANLPPEMQCGEGIQTSLGEANSTSSNYVTISNLGDTFVYVAYQSGATPPTWLTSDFTKQSSTVTLTNLVQYDVWKSNVMYAPGPITLPGNAANGGTAANTYFAVARGPDAVERCADYGATLTLNGPGGPVVADSFLETSCYVEAVPNQEFPVQPAQPLGGFGWYLDDNQSCDGILGSGEVFAYERSLSVTGLLDQTAVIDAAQQILPDQLCAPTGIGGVCTIRPAVVFIEDDGSFAQGTRVGNDPHQCTFTARFTLPGQTRVVAAGPAALDIDTAATTVVSMLVDEPGVVADVDVAMVTTANYSDNLVVLLFKDGQDVLLHQRAACDTSTSYYDVLFDDEASLPVPSSCGFVDGTFRPDDSLNVVDGQLATGDWSLHFDDDVVPGDGTDLTAWQVRIRTDITACSDDLDNDLDGFIDFDGGPGGGSPDPNCAGALDHNEKKSGRCGLGFEIALAVGALARRRRSGRSST